MKIVEILCKYCKIPIGTKEKSDKYPSQVVGKTLCNACRENAYRINNENGRKRMLENNPVFRTDVREKISNTLKRKYVTGEISSVFQNPEKLKKILAKRKGFSPEGMKVLRDKMLIHN